MPRGTLWAIYAILQFINRIIVTLHFFFRSKLFYFSKFSNFDFRLWIRGVDLVGVGIIKNYLSPTGGPGGRPSPPGSGRQIPGCVRPGFQQKLFRNTIYYRPWKFWSSYLVNFEKKPQKTGILPKSTKTQKNTKIVGMTSYSQGRLSPKFSSSKISIFLFLGRMREILEVHR